MSTDIERTLRRFRNCLFGLAGFALVGGILGIYLDDSGAEGIGRIQLWVLDAALFGNAVLFTLLGVRLLIIHRQSKRRAR